MASFEYAHSIAAMTTSSPMLMIQIRHANRGEFERRDRPRREVVEKTTPNALLPCVNKLAGKLVQGKELAPQHQFGLRFMHASFSRLVAIASTR